MKKVWDSEIPRKFPRKTQLTFKFRIPPIPYKSTTNKRISISPFHPRAHLTDRSGIVCSCATGIGGCEDWGPGCSWIMNDTANKHMSVPENSGFSPQIIHLNRVLPLFSPSILGVFLYFWFNTHKNNISAKWNMLCNCIGIPSWERSHIPKKKSILKMMMFPNFRTFGWDMLYIPGG